MVRVRAGREAARAGRGGPGVRGGAGTRARPLILKERALLLSAGAAEGGVEVTVLAAEWRGLHGRGRRRQGVGGGEVVFGRSLRVSDDWGGRGAGGRGEVPQGAVLFDQAAILTLIRPVCLRDHVRPLLLLLSYTSRILPDGVFVSVGCGTVAARGRCERVLAFADRCAGAGGGTSIDAKRTVPSVAEHQRVSTRIAQGHSPLPAGLARTASLLYGTERQQTE